MASSVRVPRDHWRRLGAGLSAAGLCALLVGAGVESDPALSGPTDDPQPYPIGVDFENDVLPVLTQAGCNTGECHGAALGQADFKLSLLGYDPQADWEAITRELRGRRVDLVAPDESLVLRKAARKLYHGGGRRLEPSGRGYAIVRDWIAAGAPRRTDPRSLLSIEVSGEDQLEVVARYDDGSWRDVTAFTRFASNDDSMVEVDEAGRLDRWRSGRTSIVARYGGAIGVLQTTEAFGEAQGRLEVANFVDEFTRERLAQLGLEPSPPAEDSAFLRRATLDLIGRIPTPREVLHFEQHPDRAALIERLVGSDAFDQLWGYRLAELFPARPGLAPWLSRQLADERSIDSIVTEALTATGTHPATALFGSNDPKLMVEGVARGFLGQSIQCAQCHNHPFSTFSRRDYFGLAAFFARTRFDAARGAELGSRGEVTIPDADAPSAPAFPGGERAWIQPEQDRREVLADWLVREPDFARALANRVWDVLLGGGLVEPLDDLRPSNPGTDPALLDALAAHFVEQGHSLRSLVATIAHSNTYATLKTPRPLRAEVLHDALADATGVPNAGQAVLEPTLPSELLDCSGRRERFDGSLAQSLHLIESPTLQDKLEAMERWPLEDLYLRVLGRRPTEAERGFEPQTREAYEDLAWALLNSYEFLYVH